MIIYNKNKKIFYILLFGSDQLEGFIPWTRNRTESIRVQKNEPNPTQPL